MEIVDFGSPLQQLLAAPAAVVLVVVAFLSMRSVLFRDRAMSSVEATVRPTVAAPRTSSDGAPGLPTA